MRMTLSVQASVLRGMIVLLAVAGLDAMAATYYWAGGKTDIANGTPISTNYAALSGVWDLTTKNWATDPNGTTYVAWPNTGSDIAYLMPLQGGTAGSVITQTVDVVAAGLSVILTNVTSYSAAGYTLTATNARTLTLMGATPLIYMPASGDDKSTPLTIGGGLKLAAPNGFTKSDWGGLYIQTDCSSVSGTVSMIRGPRNYTNRGMDIQSAANMRGVSVFDVRSSALNVSCVAGYNDQLGDAAVVRLRGSVWGGALQLGSFQYSMVNGASTETLSQIDFDGYGALWMTANNASWGKLMLVNPTAGLGRGLYGKGSGQISTAGTFPAEVLKEDIVVSNGLPTGVVIPWLATDGSAPVRLSSSNTLQVVPVAIAPMDLSTWTSVTNYAITNNPFTVVNSIPAGTVIDTLSINNGTSETLTIGSTAADTLTIRSGLIAYYNGSSVTLTNGRLTSGTNELNFMGSKVATAGGGISMYTPITGPISLSKGGVVGLTLNTSNSFTGGTYLNGGLMTLSANNAIPGDVFICGGGELNVHANQAIASAANVTIRDGGWFYFDNSCTQLLSGVMTFDNGLLTFSGNGGANSLTLSAAGFGMVFANGGVVTQTFFYANAGNPALFYLLTDVQYGAATSNQAVITSCNTNNIFNPIYLTRWSAGTRTFNVSNAVGLAAGVSEMVIGSPFSEVAGYPASIVKTGNGVLELDRVSWAVGGGAVVSNGTLLLNAAAPATNMACTITSGSATVTGLSSTSTLREGQLLATNAAIGTAMRIARVDSGSQVTLSGSASAATNLISLLACGPLGTSSVSVVGSGILGGTGGVGGNVVIQNGGTLSPSVLTNQTSTFSIGGSLTMNSGSTMTVNLVGSTCDVVSVSGAVNLNGGTLVVNGAKPAAGTILPIVTGGSLSGAFTSIPEGYAARVVGHQLQLSRSAAGFVFSAQ